MVLPVAPTNPPPIPIPQIGMVGNMPQAEAISTAVMDLLPNDQNHPSSLAANELFDFFGQAITHDVAEASTAPTTDLPLLIDGLPFPFGRSGYELDSSNVRQQVNEETSFLDLSFVYGNRDDRLDLARADNPDHTQSAKLLLGIDGLLPTIGEVAADSGLSARDVLTIYQEPGFAGLPNPTTAADGTFENIYYAGDNRATQQAPLVTLQTVLAREHNYQVDQLTPYAAANNWTPDELFNAARVITEAEWQHVVFEEYVPTLIGTKTGTLLDDYKDFIGGDAAYEAIGPGIINEWTTVAFRFGHDQSSNDYTVFDAAGGSTVIPLAQAFSALGNFLDNSNATTTAGLDTWIRGLSAQFAQEIDGRVADGNREALFGGLGGTVDLEAFDIQRGRDHGVWNYNELRAGLGLDPYADFAAFGAANGLTAERLQDLSDVYGGDISKLDSIVGGLLEKHYTGSQLGETFTLLSAIQFDLLKETDQFYYEDRLAENPELLADIKGTTFAEIMERNSGSTGDTGTVSHLNLDSFHVAKAWTGTDAKKGDSRYGSDDPAYLKADLMIGKGGNDSLYGKEGNDTLYGDAGNDKLDGGNGNDFLKAGIGNDNLYGGKGNDHAWGEDGNDCINLDGGDDWADGGKGNDSISCGDGNDIALGKEGKDDLGGGKGNDELYGGDDNDNVSGDDGDDKCYGGAGNDCVSGGKGNDRIVGEGGADQLTGGAGYDTFAFGVGSGKDKVTDFNVKQDVIDLSELAQFDSFADVKLAMTTSRSGTTTINLGDTDYDGYADTIELVGVSQKVLKEGNFVLYHEETPVV
jgi:Ca2+-binding RTX toxin-like protein